MEKINLLEVLRNCPEGMKLDCTIYENTYFGGLTEDESDEYPIIVNICNDRCEHNMYLTKEGCWTSHSEAKCVIFPKGKTSWEGFVPPYKFKDGDVLFHSDSASNGIFIFKEILQRGTIQKVICYCDYDSEDGFCLGENHTCCWTDSKILHPATKEQRDILFQKMKEAGYKWNEETKTLEKSIQPKFKVGDKIKIKSGSIIEIEKINDYYYISTTGWKLSIKKQDDWELVPDKFDITTLVPFESRVLVRDSNKKWRPAIYGFCHKFETRCAFYVVGGCVFEQCIPFENNEHLIGKIDDCDEYFKTWK